MVELLEQRWMEKNEQASILNSYACHSIVPELEPIKIITLLYYTLISITITVI